MKYITGLVIALLIVLSACNEKKTATVILPPSPYGVLPTKSQVKWQQMEYYMFVHFGPNTFTNKEWGNGKEDPKVFKPTDLDCRQWAATAKAAGMAGIVLTAKHHDGFCLWPSKFSTHTIRESGFQKGNADILRDLSAACKEYGLKFGVYLSPWDRNHPAYGTPQYNQVFTDMLHEVLTSYGPVFEQWFDGACGEGPSGKKQPYDWDLFHKEVYKDQPDAVIFSDVGPGCRWIGNEQGYAGTTNWSRLNIENYSPGAGGPPQDTLNKGNKYGTAWVPGEADVSIRPGWFYSPTTNNKIKTVDDLMNIYYASVGRNANLILNVPADRSGHINALDSIRLMEFKAARDLLYKENLAKGALLTATNTRGNSADYSIQNLLKEDYNAYWATDDSVTTASIEINLQAEKPVNTLILQEYIPLGQRIAQFNVEAWNSQSKQWVPIDTATTIGYKRILQFPSVTTSKLRINITQSLACPLLNKIGIYYVAPSNTSNASNAKGSAKVNVISLKKSVPLVVHLNKLSNLSGFYFVPVMDNKAFNVLKYNFYVSKDGKKWKLVKSKTLFDNMANNPIRQEVKFAHQEVAKYIKLEVLEIANKSKTYSYVSFGALVK